MKLILGPQGNPQRSPSAEANGKGKTHGWRLSTEQVGARVWPELRCCRLRGPETLGHITCRTAVLHDASVQVELTRQKEEGAGLQGS